MADTAAQVTIHPTTLEEIVGIQALAQSVYRRQYTDIAQADRLYQRAFSDTSLQRAIQNGAAWYYTALSGDTIVGLINFGAPLFDDCQERKEIYRLYVHPEYERQGVGGALIAAMVETLAPTVVNEVIVYQPLDNAIGKAFYEKYGFKQDPLRNKSGEGCWVRAFVK
jgi:ribosomal protein S18 acetylase RimI-like enzyme